MPVLVLVVITGITNASTSISNASIGITYASTGISNASITEASTNLQIHVLVLYHLLMYYWE